MKKIIASLILGLLLLASLTGLSFAEDVRAAEQEATLFPIPNYSGDLFSRSALTGDWGGYRTELAKKGIQFGINLTQSYQNIADGGVDEQDDFQGTVDYYLLFDSGKSGLWPGGFIELHAESYWGESIISADGALLPSNFSPVMNAPAGNGTYLTHFTVTQFLSERFAVTLGKINTAAGDTNDFAHGIGRQGFMNAAFGLNPVTFYASPYAPLGGGLIYLLGDKKQHMLTVMAWDTDAEIDEADFDSLFEGNTTYAAALRLRTNFFGKKGHQWFGYIYGDGNFTSLNQDARISFDRTGIDLTIERPVEDETWAFFYNFDQYLVTNPNDPEQGWGIFGRFGIADESTNFVRKFFSIGLGGTGLFPGRASDRFGIGYYYMEISDEVDLIPVHSDEQGIEIFYSVPLLPSTELTADVQILNGSVEAADTAVIGGIRLRMKF